MGVAGLYSGLVPNNYYRKGVRMKKVNAFHTVKGGVGCTTTAVGYACWLASDTGQPVTLIALTNDDAKLVLDSKWENQVNVVVYDNTFDNLAGFIDETLGYVVIDAGSTPHLRSEWSDWAKHLVVENHYLCLRQMTMSQAFGEKHYDDLVVLMSEGASLTLNDCSLVSKLPIFLSVDRNKDVARRIDAGLFPNPTDVRRYQPNLVGA